MQKYQEFRPEKMVIMVETEGWEHYLRDRLEAVLRKYCDN